MKETHRMSIKDTSAAMFVAAIGISIVVALAVGSDPKVKKEVKKQVNTLLENTGDLMEKYTRFTNVFAPKTRVRDGSFVIAADIQNQWPIINE